VCAQPRVRAEGMRRRPLGVLVLVLAFLGRVCAGQAAILYQPRLWLRRGYRAATPAHLCGPDRVHTPGNLARQDYAAAIADRGGVACELCTVAARSGRAGHHPRQSGCPLNRLVTASCMKYYV